VGAEGDARAGGLEQPALGEKASYYSAVCPETGEVETMEVEGNSNAETRAAFLAQLRANHPGPLVVIWDNGPAHRGGPIREYLATPGLDLRPMPLPPYSPDFNADEAIWDWARAEVTANTCLGTKAKSGRRWPTSSAARPSAPRRSNPAAAPPSSPDPLNRSTSRSMRIPSALQFRSPLLDLL
jgi:transposase